MDLQKGILYGPLHSRRLGLSLGVNLLPDSFKLCSLNCCYCQYGWTHSTQVDGHRFIDEMPAPDEVEQAVLKALEQSVAFDYLTLCGNGEPTLHPKFELIVDKICEIRDQAKIDFKIAVISNSTTCFDPDIKSALGRIDLALMKLDVGNEFMFRKLNGKSAAATFDKILAGLQELDRYFVQTMFVKGAIDNSCAAEVSTWLDTLTTLKPECVQVYSLARSAASDKIYRVEKNKLEEIAALGRQKTGFQFDVF